MSPVGSRKKSDHRHRAWSTNWSPAAENIHQHIRDGTEFPGPPMLRPTRPSYSLNSPEPEPRAFHQLLAERTYLLGVLHEENEKATQLLRKVQPLEEAVILTQSRQQHRLLKKQLGWLKSRIKETTSQEKSILRRLAHLSYEIQAQERWSQIQHEQLQYFQSINARQNFSPSMYQNMTLDPLSPEFQPQRYMAACPVWFPQQFPPFNTYEGYFPPNSGYAPQFQAQTNGVQERHAMERQFEELPREDKVSEQHAQQHEYQEEKRGRGQRHPMIHRSSSMNSGKFNILATNTLFIEIPQRKRHSMVGITGVDKAWADNIAMEQPLENGAAVEE